MSFQIQSKPLKTRCEYLDCVKGVSILAITFMHIEDGVIPGWLFSWIGLFMITAFYFASGWIFSLKSKLDAPKELFHKRIRQLGIPYLWFTLLILLFELIWWGLGQTTLYIISRDIYKTVTLRGIGTLWFLPVLFFGEMLFCIIRNTKRPWVYGGVLFLISVCSSYIYYVKWVPLLEGGELYKIFDSPVRPIVMALDAWPIIGVGYLVGKYFNRFLIEKNKWLSAIAGSIALIVSIWFVIAPPFQFFYINKFISNILPAIGFIGVFALLSSSWIGRFFKYWGKHSLIMMCTHFSITMELLMAFDYYVLHHAEFTGPITIIYFCVAVLLTYPLVKLFEGRLSFMLGKK